MAITKQSDGTWKLDMRVAGRDSRIRKTFTTKAKGYERDNLIKSMKKKRHIAALLVLLTIT
ncbi:hypothetical protein [Shewanella xiamenensis]|uniref:hypothetical protein n=1 Tax=Shewanella xiamenensis TaxID=332186 RepID=UPI00313E1236